APDRRRHPDRDERQPVSLWMLQPHPCRDSPRRRTDRRISGESCSARVRSGRVAGRERVISEFNLDRRGFLAGTALVAGGLVLGVFPEGCASAMPNAREGSFRANAWLQITPADEVIFQLDKTEMGQGVLTALPTILAEELEIDPRRIVVEMAPVNT